MPSGIANEISEGDATGAFEVYINRFDGRPKAEQRRFQSALDAVRFFGRLCLTRTAGPAVAVLLADGKPRKIRRLDDGYVGNRCVLDLIPIEQGTQVRRVGTMTPHHNMSQREREEQEESRAFARADARPKA